MKLGVLYVIFACIATIANLATQEITINLYPFAYPLIVSIIAGTLIGLITKYFLDKRYIFSYQTENHSKDFQTFVLYSSMSIITTLIFWISEFAFDAYFGTKFMRYVGAVLGLSIGYITKYQLDRKYVFIER